MSSNNKIRAGVATYDEVLDSLKDTERLLIDVRDVADVETGQIPTSINIPLEKINSELRLSAPAFSAKYERPKPGIYDEIIFYCKIGDKAQIACEYAISLGFRNVKNYKGGWREWSYKWVEWDEWVDPDMLSRQANYNQSST